MKRIIAGIIAVIMAAGIATGCGKKAAEEEGYKDDVKTTDIAQAVADELGDNYWPSQTVSDSEAASLYGLTADNYEELTVQLPMIGTNADLLLVAKAKDGKAEDVKTEIEALRERNVADTMQYPMNIQKIAASKVVVMGDYVVYIQLGGDAVEKESDEEIKAGCESENDKAEAAIEALLKK